MNTQHSSVINLILLTSYHVTLPSRFCVTINLYLLKHFVIIWIYANTVLELLTLEHYLLTNDSQGPRFEPWRPWYTDQNHPHEKWCIFLNNGYKINKIPNFLNYLIIYHLKFYLNQFANDKLYKYIYFIIIVYIIIWGDF